MNSSQPQSISLAAKEIFNNIKNNSQTDYREEKHCLMLLEVMLNPNEGTVGAFCVRAMITDTTFYNWCHTNPFFRELYYYGKMLARQVWEEEGETFRNAEYQMGTINHAFEHWKMIGWSRHGVSKNNRLKLRFKQGDSPIGHFNKVLEQAAEGDFTASEFKQLMEAVNVGLNVVQTIDMQKQIDELKSDLNKLTDNRHVENPFANKGIT